MVKGGIEMGILYAKDGKIYCNDYMEIYVPSEYFEGRKPAAVNEGSSVKTIGILYTKAFHNGKEEPLKLLNIPSVIKLMVYDFKYETIDVKGKPLEVMTLQYLKDSYVLHQTVPNGREVAETFLASILSGKLPKTLNYSKIIDIWWRNLEISGVSFKVPSKIYEMIIASIYRNPRDTKERYGQLYARQNNPSGYDYVTGNVRSVVKDLSTFSGMVFEDISTMITNGISNSRENIEEAISPLEKIIHY